MSTSALIYRRYAPQTVRHRAEWLSAWLPVLLFSTVVVAESTQYFGADRTSEPLQRVAEALFGYDIGVYWGAIHHAIRKTGHFMGYGMFSLVCFRGFWLAIEHESSRLTRRLRAHGLAILVTFLVAGADEFHQCFVPNRCGQFSDVLLDTCGAAVLGVLLYLRMQWGERWSDARSWTRHTRMSAYEE